MPAHDLETLLSWRGRTVRDPSGDKIGKLGDLYLDPATDLPAYAGVRTGLLGTHEAIVPLHEARDVDGDVEVPYDAELVRAAPKLAPGAVLTSGEEFALDQHYGVQADRSHGTEEPGTMLRSEEEVRVEVGEMAPTERVRLKKVLVTEEVEKIVPVRREVIQLETDAPPAGTIKSVEDVEDVQDVEDIEDVEKTDDAGGTDDRR